MCVNFFFFFLWPSNFNFYSRLSRLCISKKLPHSHSMHVRQMAPHSFCYTMFSGAKCRTKNRNDWSEWTTASRNVWAEINFSPKHEARKSQLAFSPKRHIFICCTKSFFFSRQNCDFIAVNLLPKLNFLFKFAFSKANEAKVLRTKREKKNAEFLCLFWKSILLRFPQASWQEDEKNCSVSQWQ